MMPTIEHRTDDWRYETYEQGARCRQLWANVLKNAVSDAALEVRNLRAKDKPELVTYALESFRRWAMSGDGRKVFAFAGINWDPKAVEILCSHVASGEFDTTRERRKSREP